MDSEVLFVRPADVFSMQTDMTSKSPDQMALTGAWDHDDKFSRYDSSPESIESYTDESFLFSPIDEDIPAGLKHILDTIQQQTVPYQAQLDTCAACPIPLNSLEQSLITTYLTDYAETLYRFHPDMRPHPMATLLSVSMTNPACLHLILARSAQYRLIWNKYDSVKQQQELEVAMIHHKCEAIQMIRNLSTNPTPGQQPEDLIGPIIGLGKLDYFSRASDTASMHFGAARQLVKSIGGPSQIQSLWLSRALVHFECNHSVTTESFVWDQSDFAKLHAELNQFLSKVRSVEKLMPPPPNSRKRKSMDGKAPPSPQEHKPRITITPDSILLNYLIRKPNNLSEPTHQDRLEMISQLTCLLTLCTILVDHQYNRQALQGYLNTVQDLVATLQSQDQATNNLMWLLQIHDHSEVHSKRVWAAAGWTWILRHVSFNVQGMVKDWLIAILTGKSVSRTLKLDSFAFSYAS